MTQPDSAALRSKLTRWGENASHTTIRFAWTPPSGRVTATYRAEVREYQADGDRYLCRLAELLAVKRSGSGEDVSDDALRGLVGKCVRVPGEALDGMVLPLKMATLTGGLARPYFIDAE